MCRRHQLLGAEAYVQERVGNVAQALELHLKSLQNSVATLVADEVQGAKEVGVSAERQLTSAPALRK